MGCDENYMVESPKDYSKYLFDLVDTLKWRNLTFLLIERPGRWFPYRHYFEDSYNLLKNTKKFCLRKKIVNIKRKRGLTKEVALKLKSFLIKETSNKSVLVVFSNNDRVNSIFMTILKRVSYQKNLILHDWNYREDIAQTNWIDVRNRLREQLAIYQQVDSQLGLSENEELQYRLSFLLYKKLFGVQFMGLDLTLDYVYSLLKNPKTFMNPVSNRLLKEFQNKSLIEKRSTVFTNT